MVKANALQCLIIITAGSLPGAAQVTQSPAFALYGEPPALVQTENPKFNVSTMGLQISSDFDDNGLNSARKPQADFAVFIQPHLGWRVSGARMQWVVDYTLGFSRSQEFPAYDSLSHLLDGGFQVKLTKRLGLLVHEALLSSANPFDQLQAAESATGPVNRPVQTENTSTIPAKVWTEQARADIAYALTAHSTAGVGGDFFSARYSLPSVAFASNQILQNSSSTTGRSYYLRQVARHQWTGIDYRVQKLIFNSGQSASLVHSLAYTHTIAVSPEITLSMFAGPERSVTQTVSGTFSALSPVFAGPRSAWQWLGGVTGGWNGARTRLNVRLFREINNAGILGAAQLSTGSAELSRSLARQWSVRLLASYDRGKALDSPGTLSTLSAAVGLKRTLAPDLFFELQYWRVQISSNGSLPASLLADHNRISMSFAYERERPLGR
jgi:hypothetical protein